MKELSSFSKRMISARESLQLSQEGLANKAGMAPAAISHFETGARKPSFDNLRKLANALDVTSDFLLCRTDDPHGNVVTGDVAYRHALNGLTEDQKKIAMDMIQVLKNQNQRKG